ncbi:MAG: hypothetical protein K2P81_13350 [Bacteriovoracaceae bacterium]|nr:hypothetical protein [Bacteriovoracaceae bacterium]
MKLTFIVLGMLLAYMSTRAIAANCPSADQLSPSNKSVRELIGKAENFNSVEDFVSALPNEMRSNFVMMADSRSFQAGNRENPRVIMASTDGSVRVTFGTDPNARGFNNIEISIWNPEKGEFEYKEVAYKEENGKMHGDENPRACQTCHGKPPKPNWDTYNYWSGAVPFNKDKLIRGSEEANWYLGYLDRIEKKVLRMPALML